MPPGATPPSRLASWPPVVLVAGVIAGAALLAYANSWGVPFLFDDQDAILANPSLRQLWPPWLPLTPPTDGCTATGRPLFNLTLALNYAAGGTAVGGYHAVNLGLHILASLALFGVLRRTLRRAPLAGRFGPAALPLAGATALLWVLHPLQTESVTYIVQRAECLAGLCLLLTLYAFIRSVEGTHARRWQVLAIATCTLGMASKEVMAAAPVLVWCYDRTFVSGDFRTALRGRSRFYAALAATWLPLGFFVLGMGGNRGVSAGFGQGVSVWDYALAQCEAILRYLRLVGWPHPLVFDYGITLPPLARVLPAAALLALLLGASLLAFARRWPSGFAAIFFFAVLAPSSSLVPIATQTMAEHRLYLPLAAVLATLAAAAWTILGPRVTLAALGFAAAALGLATFQRNHDYRSAEALWRDVTLKRPDNPRGFDNYGLALLSRGELAAAVPALETAVRLNPQSAHSREALGSLFLRLGQLEHARLHFQTAVQLAPHSASGHGGLAAIAYQTGNYADAVRALEAAIRGAPRDAGYRRNHATALFLLGRTEAALAAFAAALPIAPDDAELHADFGAVALRAGQPDLARRHSQEAVRLDPRHARAHFNLGLALRQLGQVDGAIRAFRHAQTLNPSDPDARDNLAALEALRAAATPR